MRATDTFTADHNTGHNTVTAADGMRKRTPRELSGLAMKAESKGACGGRDSGRGEGRGHGEGRGLSSQGGELGVVRGCWKEEPISGFPASCQHLREHVSTLPDQIRARRAPWALET